MTSPGLTTMPPAEIGVVDLAGPAVQRPDRADAAREDREVLERLDVGQVADQAVDHEALDAAVAGLRGDEVAQDAVHHRRAGVDDDDVAGLGDVQALVDHQVVAGVDLDRAGRPEQPQVLAR